MRDRPIIDWGDEGTVEVNLPTFFIPEIAVARLVEFLDEEGDELLAAELQDAYELIRAEGSP